MKITFTKIQCQSSGKPTRRYWTHCTRLRYPVRAFCQMRGRLYLNQNGIDYPKRRNEMQVCPCCKRKMPVAKRAVTNRDLARDLGKAESAIEALESALRWPNESESFREAVQMELLRMNRALTDHDLLWRIYRRNSKNPSYAAVSAESLAA